MAINGDDIVVKKELSNIELNNRETSNLSIKNLADGERQASNLNQSISETPAPIIIKKQVLPENKLEVRLNIKDLEALQSAFNFKHDSTERLSLNKEQFIEALSIILNKGTDDEYEELFDKIDVSHTGLVAWDQLAQHMLLQFYEKDDKVRSTQLPQWKDLKILNTPHKEVIQRVEYVRNSQRYVSVSKEGTIALLNTDLELQRIVKTGTDACKTKDLWVTDFVILQTLNKIAISFTSKEIAFYDISSKSDFSCQYKIEGLTSAPICMDYWHNSLDINEAVLCWGDVKGNVCAVFFLSAGINLFERQSTATQDKQETTLVIKFSDLKKGMFQNSNKYISYVAHTDWTRQVKYLPSLECFLSCATTWQDSMVIGWIEKRTTMNSQVMNIKKDVLVTETRDVQRLSIFQVHQGVNAFDHHEVLNLIASAGANNHVCLWNPYVISKPNGVLTGHVAPVIAVLFNKSKSQVVSFSKDKILRIWDVQLQVCLQRLAGIFPKGPEDIVPKNMQSNKLSRRVFTRLFLLEERGRLFLTFNQQLSLLEMKPELKDRVLSHERPITACLFNAQLNQVVSACQGGVLTFWLIDSGQKVRSTPNAHGDAEITALANDPDETRFYSGATDGFVKIWDWNGHCYHELDCTMDGNATEITQILILKHSIIPVGFSRWITVFRTHNFKDYRVSPGEWKDNEEMHDEDIMSAAYLPPHQLITGSYDGVLMSWNSSSETMTKRMTQRSQQPAAGIPNDSRRTSSSSRRSARSASNRKVDEADGNYTISRLKFLDTRKSKSKSTANLVSCGANGVVRFWNSNTGQLLGEFVAHKQASRIIMNINSTNENLITGDGDGNLKVWNIQDYCVRSEGAEGDIVTSAPVLDKEWQAHMDQINTIELTFRQERWLIITGSSDFSLSVWDLFGNKIGSFGQEHHWKIEHLSVILERIERENEELAAMEIEPDEIIIEPEKDWRPDERAIDDPENYRINAWDTSVLGKEYQELRLQKRQRKQPSTYSGLPYLAYDKSTPAPGPFNNVDITSFAELQEVRLPAFVEHPEQFFRSKDQLPPGAENLPVLAENALKAAFDERSLFPKYVLDFETQLRKYQNREATAGKEQTKTASSHSNVTSAATGQKGKPKQSKAK